MSWCAQRRRGTLGLHLRRLEGLNSNRFGSYALCGVAQATVLAVSQQDLSVGIVVFLCVFLHARFVPPGRDNIADVVHAIGVHVRGRKPGAR